MIRSFNRLTEREMQQLYELPLYVALLVADADGHIDSTEVTTAIKLARKGEIMDSGIHEFQQIAFTDFEDKLKFLISTLPKESGDRKNFFNSQLHSASDAIKKLDQELAVKLYDNVKRLGKKIASASGGIFGFGGISDAELELLELRIIKDA